MIRTAVIAGTPVDTRMGVEYLQKKNEEKTWPEIVPLYMPVAESCDDQIKFQYSDPEGKRKTIDAIFDAATADGVKDFFIYCNSLSGAFDFDSYAEEKNVRIYTPLQVYRSLGREYSRVGVMAANNLSAYGIEKNLMAANQDIYMIGSGNMSIVHSIESGLSPEEIVEGCGLVHLLRYMEACGCEALILGCTHFPYLREELSRHTSMPIIDPADKMHAALCRAACK